MNNIAEQISEVLRELKNSGDVEASIVMRRDGVVIFSDSQEISSKNFSVVSSLISVTETTSLELKRGVFQEIVIESENGRIVAVSAGKSAILLSLLKKDSNLGFVLLSLENAAKRIDKILSND